MGTKVYSSQRATIRASLPVSSIHTTFILALKDGAPVFILLVVREHDGIIKEERRKKRRSRFHRPTSVQSSASIYPSVPSSEQHLAQELAVQIGQ